jgi:hypothetical protein
MRRRMSLKVEQELVSCQGGLQSTEEHRQSAIARAPLPSAEALVATMEKSSLVEFGQRKFFNRAQEFSFDMAPQPQVAKDFKLLQKILIDHKKAGYTNVMLVDNPGPDKATGRDL